MHSKIRRILAASVAAAMLAAGFVSPALAQAVNPAGTTGYSGPVAIGQNVGGLTGSYSKTLTSGTMAAGLGAAAPVFSFRYGGSGYAVIKEINVEVVNAGTAFTAGVGILNLVPARAFTASDSGGTAATLTGNNGKLRTSLATTGVSDIRIASTATLTAGTRTLDTDPIANLVLAVPATTTNYQMAGPNEVLYGRNQAGDYPMVLATNEGVVLNATLPATGTWTLSVTIQWDEFAAF